MPGMDRIRAKLQTHMAKAVAAGVTQARVEGEKIAQLARAFAGNDTGELDKSIKVAAADTVKLGGYEVGFVGVVVTAGDETTIVTNKAGERFQNALIQEYGTREHPANPFFGPAKRLQKTAAKAAIRRATAAAWRG